MDGTDDPLLTVLVELALLEINQEERVLGTTLIDTPILWRRFIKPWVEDVVMEQRALQQIDA